MATLEMVTACAALTTGLASLFMVLEMRKQRAATSKPILKFNGSHAIVRYNTDDLPIPTLINYGAGSAINIHIEWYVNLKAIIETVKQYDPCGELKIKENGSYVQIEHGYFSIDASTQTNINGIQPYSYNEPLSIKLPLCYQQLYLSYIEYIFVKRSKKGLSTSTDAKDFPALKGNISYEDINKKQFNQKIEVLYELSHVCNVEIGVSIVIDKM